VSHRLIRSTGRKDPSGWRLPAPQLEALVASLIRTHLHVPIVQANVVTKATSEETASIAKQLTDLSNPDSQTDEKKVRVLLGLIENVQITPGRIRISIMAKAIAKQLAVEQKRICDEHLNIEANFRHRKRGVETKLILADAIGTRDETLFKNIALAHRYFDLIQSGKTYTEIAEAEGSSKRRIQQLVELAFLAPDIIRGVWEGAQPVGLTSQWLKTHSFTPIWNGQRELFKTL
jgi:site-specific DNA recombinase